MLGGCYTSRGSDGVIVGWVQPTALTPFPMGCTHPTNDSPAPSPKSSAILPDDRVLTTFSDDARVLLKLFFLFRGRSPCAAAFLC